MGKGSVKVLSYLVGGTKLAPCSARVWAARGRAGSPNAWRQASRRDANAFWAVSFRGLKPHGYRHWVAPRLAP